MSRSTAVIVDPDRLFREGLEKLLRSSKLTILASVKRFAELSVELVPEKPNLIVFGLDRDTDAGDQLQFLSNARTSSPHPRVVLLIHSTERDLLLRAAAAGLDAVLSRDISSVILQRSLELVMLGQQVFPAPALGSGNEAATHFSSPPSPTGEQNEAIRPQLEAGPAPNSANPSPAASLTKRLLHTTPLSDREDQILQRLIAGAPNKVIARDLGITEGTVKVHVKTVCRKLGANNRTQAAIWGAETMKFGRRPLPPKSPADLDLYTSVHVGGASGARVAA